jgi:hypothetical protein
MTIDEIIDRLCREHECSPQELAGAVFRYSRIASRDGETARDSSSSSDMLRKFNALTPHAQVEYFCPPRSARGGSSVVAGAKWILYTCAYVTGATGMIFIAGLSTWLTLYFIYWAFV